MDKMAKYQISQAITFVRQEIPGGLEGRWRPLLKKSKPSKMVPSDKKLLTLSHLWHKSLIPILSTVLNCTELHCTSLHFTSLHFTSLNLKNRSEEITYKMLGFMLLYWIPFEISKLKLIFMIGAQIVLQGVILSVAIITQAERKVMGAMQRRIGPNKVGYLGIQQPFADGLKLIQKETILPQESSHWLFQGAPFLTFYQALLNWLVLPQDYGLAQSEIMGGGILIIIAISEQGIYGVQYAGWAANSKYPFQGSLRSTAQMISYSVSQSQILQCAIFTQGTVNLLEIMHGQLVISLFWALLPMAFIFIISAIAETSRPPMDLPEAESEQVAGFFTEHSAIGFVYFFQGEYTNILTISTLFFILFFGTSMAIPMIFFMIWIRASQARLRFDQQLTLGWSHFLPFTIGYIMFLPPFLYAVL